MVKIYYEKDANLSILKDETIAIIGYGNQGGAQAQNMRDSGLNVIVGSRKDKDWDRAVQDGFKVYPISDAVKRADIIFFLVPDEMQSTVFEREVKNNLTAGKALVFAHGYSIRYGLLVPPQNVDVLLLAPRVTGIDVRERFVKGHGAPAFVYVKQDASGKAKQRVLALAKAIGATRAGAMEISFDEETELDHFNEHWVAPMMKRIILLAFEVLVGEFGYTPEAVLMELYVSGERSDFLREFGKTGFYEEIKHHSTTSQYGTLSREPRVLPDEAKKIIRGIVEDIKAGVFAREWQLEQERGYPAFNKLKEAAFKHPINKAEKKVKELVKIENS
ncbi:MAG: ketol-acid reductoisomerase [Chloroflexota bacterium]